MKRAVVISLFGSVAAAWPVTAQMQTQPPQPTKSMMSSAPPKIEMVRVKRIDPGPKLRFQLSDGSVDLMKVFSLGGADGIGATWKMPRTGETFDVRYGRW
jgi:hypothetical protein